MELGTTEFWDKLRDDPAALAAEVCSIDLVNLHMSLQMHAALRAWVGAAHESARVAEARVNWDLTKARALAMLRFGEVGGRPPKHVLDARVEGDDDVIELTEALLNAQEKRGALRAMSDALDHRRDMLVQLAAKQRQEQSDYGR